MQTILKQLVRDRKGNPRGYVVAVLVEHPSLIDGSKTTDPEQSVRIGWSYTNISAGDRFNKNKGFDIAYNRAASGHSTAMIPNAVLPLISSMNSRAEKYFKTSNIHIIGQ